MNTDKKILVPAVGKTPEEQALMAVLNRLVACLNDSETPIVRIHRGLNSGDLRLISSRRENPDKPTQYEFRAMPDFHGRLWLNVYLVMSDPTGSSFTLTPKQTTYLYSGANNPLFASRLKLFAEHVVDKMKQAADAAIPTGDVVVGDEESVVLDQALSGLGPIRYSTVQLMGRRLVHDHITGNPAVTIRNYLTPEAYTSFFNGLYK